MRVKRSSLLVLSIVALGIIVLLVYWVPSFFVDEFYNVSIAYTEKSVTITPSPDELQNALISKWTDVSATFKNDSGSLCPVEVKSASLTKNFSLEKNSEYGLILPKKETITISFCGVKKDIQIDS
jgi:hypothetical protein